MTVPSGTLLAKQSLDDVAHLLRGSKIGILPNEDVGSIPEWIGRLGFRNQNSHPADI